MSCGLIVSWIIKAAGRMAAVVRFLPVRFAVSPKMMNINALTIDAPAPVMAVYRQQIIMMNTDLHIFAVRLFPSGMNMIFRMP